MFTFAPPASVSSAALLRWTESLDRVLPPRREASPPYAVRKMRADVRRWHLADEASVFRRSLVDVRQAVAQSAAVLPRGPRLTTRGEGLTGTLAATANLLAATLGCGARLAIALVVSCAAVPAGLVLALGRALLGRPCSAPPVVDWQLVDDAQRAALQRLYTAAMQFKVTDRRGGQPPPFAQSQFARDLPRQRNFLSVQDERHGRAADVSNAGPQTSSPRSRRGEALNPRATPKVGPALGSLAALEVQLRALVDDDGPWFHQLAALACQSVGNSMVDTFLVGTGWRRVGAEVFAPGEHVTEMGAALFFNCTNAFNLRLVRPKAAKPGDGRPHVRFEVSMAWSPEPGAGAWRRVCAMDGRPEPRSPNFSTQGLQLHLSLNLLRPAAHGPNVVQLEDVRLSARPGAV